MERKAVHIVPSCSHLLVSDRSLNWPLKFHWELQVTDLLLFFNLQENKIVYLEAIYDLYLFLYRICMDVYKERMCYNYSLIWQHVRPGFPTGNMYIMTDTNRNTEMQLGDCAIMSYHNSKKQSHALTVFIVLGDSM